jgi:hypothetical protein
MVYCGTLGKLNEKCIHEDSLTQYLADESYEGSPVLPSLSYACLLKLALQRREIRHKSLKQRPKRDMLCRARSMRGIARLNNTLDLFIMLVEHLEVVDWNAQALVTSKKRFSHHTWKKPWPTSTMSWKMLHHLMRALVLSAVFLCTRSRTMM